VGVVALQAIVHQPKAGTRAASRQGALDLPNDPDRTKRWQSVPKTQSDMCWKGPMKVLPRRMRQTGMRTGLTTRAGAATTPAAR
jgi:hypothetical protein